MWIDERDRIGGKRYRKKRNPWSYVIGTVLLIVLLSYAVQIFFQIKVESLNLFKTQPAPSLAPAARDELLKDHAESQYNYIEPSISPPKPTERQTVFNDSNYQPKGAINTIAPPPARYYEQGQAQTDARVREINRSFNGAPKHTPQSVVTKSAQWQWTSVVSGTGGRGKTIRGIFSYQVRNGRINTTSVCSNEDYGSLRYRDCRKGAKAYFVSRCNAGDKEACTARNMMP